MGVSVPVKARGIVVKDSDPVVKKLDFSDSPPRPASPKVRFYPPTPNPKVVRAFKKVLANLRKPPVPKVKVVAGITKNPHFLRPIGLKSCKIKENYPLTPEPRKKNALIDDSAVESDGEGGDISSRCTTLAPAPPLTPAIKKTKERVICDICGATASSIHQLKQHQKGKKCRSKANRKNFPNVDLFCPTCKKSFSSLHNFHNLNCRNFSEVKAPLWILKHHLSRSTS